MNGLNGGTVPNDMWQCCGCGGGNLIALADEQCPVCGHTRDISCKGPGSQMSFAAPSFNCNHGPPRLYCNTSMVLEPSVIPACPLRPQQNDYNYTGHYETHRGEGISIPGACSGDYGDMWQCSNCGADNNDWLDFCPLCGTAKP
ncbi:hypothetical protein K469DRAFT_709966 [Zopfia rhizophila CBS 207.26]|uniref:RanBP2-type domain-containing protein n=1 Tax=Zopfia rhizophila CBS 207.26 TaxID=1314779 RepID=A0A6A6DWK5_9PEZI|nr:hypothetical protein K469DRAFT_709966 [Zopfia rhizophila CBS 207.26]